MLVSKHHWGHTYGFSRRMQCECHACPPLLPQTWTTLVKGFEYEAPDSEGNMQSFCLEVELHYRTNLGELFGSLVKASGVRVTRGNGSCHAIGCGTDPHTRSTNHTTIPLLCA